MSQLRDQAACLVSPEVAPASHLHRGKHGIFSGCMVKRNATQPFQEGRQSNDIFVAIFFPWFMGSMSTCSVAIRV